MTIWILYFSYHCYRTIETYTLENQLQDLFNPFIPLPLYLGNIYCYFTY